MVACFLAVAVYLAVSACTIYWVGHHDSGTRADAVVVLGAAQYNGVPSPLLRARLQHALNVFNAGRVRLIAVTGGNKPGDKYTEGSTSRKWLEERGVPASGILMENEGNSTWASLANLAPRLKSAGVRSVVVSTDSWHEQRSVLSLRQLGFKASASTAHRVTPARGRVWLKYAKESVGVAVGRIIGFHRLLSITG
jgi:vancomycin permeability regulator SanA